MRHITISVALLGLLGLPITAAQGATSTKSFTHPTPSGLELDAQTNVTVGTVTFAASDFGGGGGGYTVGSVSVATTWTKTEGSCPAPLPGPAYHSETGMRIVGPTGATLSLIDVGSYSGGGVVGTITTTFDDGAAGSVSGVDPVSGTFTASAGSLDTFFGGLAAEGVWTLQATDSGGFEPLCVFGFSVTITSGALPNVPPVAEANGAYTGSKFGTNAVSAAGSTDSDGTIVLYEWDCEGNGSFEVSATSVNAACGPFTLGGVYSAVLRVTDDAGDTNTDTATITVPNVTPIAEANGPYTANQGVAITASGATSSDPDGASLSFAWDCDISDGVAFTAGGLSQSCTYPDDGAFTGRLRVCDLEGACDTDDFTANITNTSPTADAGGPYTTVQGVAVTILSSGSSDPDGTISQFAWDCDASNGVSFIVGTSTNSCTYADDGSYTATLRVTDDDGATATDTATVTATNTVPIADAGGPYPGSKNSPITLSGVGSTDSDGTIVSYQWDCDAADGVGFTPPSVSPGYVCSYLLVGSYTVTLRVTDDDGATDLDTGTVSITNNAPVANAGGPYTVAQGQALLVDGSGSTDGDGFITGYAWDCDVANGVAFSSNTASTAFNCNYSAPGTFTVRLRVTDDNGATDTGDATVTVTNTSPLAEAGGAYFGGQGLPIAVFSFGSSDPDGTIVSYEWDCASDGTFETTIAAQTGATCTYATVGSYTVTLRVTDNNGATDTDTGSVSVGNQLPIAEASGPYAAGQGLATLLDGSGSSDVDGSIVSYAWDCDASNGLSFSTPSASPVISCTYANVGVFTATLRVVDDDGATATDTSAVTVSNGTPLAVAGGPYAGVKAVPVTVSGSSSADADGTIVNFAWDCTSDGIVDVQGPSPVAQCSYPLVGTYTITLTVTDDDGGTDSDLGTVNIPLVGPIAEAGGPYPVVQGGTVLMDGSASFDSDGSIVLWEWDCTSDGVFDVSGLAGSGDACVYPATGVFTILLRVTDDDGVTDTDVALVSVTNLVPVADAGGPYTGTEATAVALNGTGSADLDGFIAVYSWDCNNDGVPDAISALPLGSVCVFQTIGTYVVTLTVTDDDGATDIDSATVVISSSPPLANAGGPYGGNEGTAIALNGAASSDQGGIIALYEWDCTSNGSYDSSSFSPVGATCSYVDEGNFTVTMRITDDDGDQATAVAQVTVNNADPVVVGPAGPTTGNEGQNLNWSVTATDPGVTDVLSYFWDFGDGATATGASANHVFADDGSYTITVTVTDGDGGSDSDSIVVVIGNVAPVLGLVTVPSTANEGQVLTFSAAATDIGAQDGLSFGWSFGDGGSASGAAPNYTYADDGTFTVTVTVTDDSGATDSATANVTVLNVAPFVSSLAGPSSGMEGAVLTYTGVATDVGVADVLTFSWNFGDGNLGSGPVVSNIFANEGQYSVVLTVTDGDGGSDTKTITVLVGNAAPVVVSLTAPGGDEGAPVSFSATATDAGVLDTLTYGWDFGDGTVGAGAATTHVYDDDGSYPAVLTVTDDAGDSVQLAVTVQIANVNPTITTMLATPSTTTDEGDEIDFSASATDQGPADILDLTYVWDFGDGSAVINGYLSEHTWPDDGLYTVTLTVQDGDGGVAVQTLSVEVLNVAPEIGTSPPINALQDTLYSYQPTVVDPGDEVFTWSLSPSAPATMTIDASTGLIAWTPLYADYLVGQYSIVMTVLDNDGGQDQQSWTITVFSTDSDGDGMPDDWELEHGLNPFDPIDAGNDPDQDGVTNLGEFSLGQDPFVYDGPSVPTPISPIQGVEIAVVSPDLLVANATDPQGEILYYEFEVYADEFLNQLVTASGLVVEDSSGQTFWKVDLQLTEDAEYWWVARASDPWTAGPWSAPERFILNEVNDPPEAPILIYPIQDELVTVLEPTFEWTGVIDPNEDPVTYDLIVWAADGLTVLVEWFDLPDSGASTSTFLSDVSFADNADYVWAARSVDNEGLFSDWTEPETFFINTANEAPGETFFIDPVDQSSVEPISPTLTAIEVTDPEGTAVSYEFEVDQVASFDSFDYASELRPATGLGTVSWSLAVDDVELRQNEWAWARVRAVDSDGVASAPDTITFFVRGPNDPAEVPVLVTPANDSVVDSEVVLQLADVTDPEGDVVFYDFLLARDADMTDIVDGAEGVLAGAGPLGAVGFTSRLVPVALAGEYWWTARSRDEFGAVSEWASSHHFTTVDENDDGFPDDLAGSFTAGGGGCRGSQSTVAGSASPSALGWALLPLAAIVLRRRRP